MEDEQTNLGSCCGCGTEEGVWNVVMLPYPCAVPGHGYGCLVCRLPPDGASMVLCDLCFDGWREDRIPVGTVCRGYPAEDGREPLADAQARGRIEHDVNLHRLAEPEHRQAWEEGMQGRWDG